MEFSEKTILESDRIVIGNMENSVLCFKIKEFFTPYKSYKNGSVDVRSCSWRNLIVEISPRIDCGFNAAFNFNTVTSGDVRFLAKALSKLADDMEKTPPAVE